MDARRIATRAGLGLLLAAYIAGGLARISFNVDVLKLLPARLGTVTGLSLFAQHFSRPSELLVTVEAPTDEAAEAAVQALGAKLRARPDLAARVVTESPWESRPQDLAEFLAYLLINQPPAEFQKLLTRMAPEHLEETLQETKETLASSLAAREVAMAGYDPLGMMQSLDLGRFASASNLSEFSSADGAFRVLYVEAAAWQGDYRKAIAWMKEVRAVAGSASLPASVQVHFTGEPAFVAEVSGQMQWDMMSSGFLTVTIIALIFWLCFRRFRPLADLVGMLGLTFMLSLSTAGWVLGQLSIIGVGFTSIMIGLSVDYGYMIYQASLTRPEAAWVRRRVLPYVLWAAGTTSAAFFTLNASSLPGLNHLGNLVGLGVLIGAVVMLAIFIPLVVRALPAVPEPSRFERWLARPGVRRGGFWFTAALVALLLATLAVRGWPGFDSTGRALKMRNSEANDALERIYAKLTDERDFMSFIVTGHDDRDLLAHLRELEPKLQAAQQDGRVRQMLSPLLICADAAAQAANLAAAGPTVAAQPRLEAAVAKAGFLPDAFGLTHTVLEQWRVWAETKHTPVYPVNETSRWILRRMLVEVPGQMIAMGLLQPAPGAEEKLIGLQTADVHLVSWPLLAHELRRVIPREFGVIIVSLLGLLLILLAIAFRSLRDVALMAGTMALVFLALLGAMQLLGLPWNAFNIAAIMLLLGTGTDYSIYIILSLKRNGGAVEETQRTTGLVVFLCAGSAAAGFGALGWAGHLGLASLGQVCALGLVLDALISVFLLPVFRQWRRGG